MTEPTKADLKAAVATLTKDNAALRDLLAAIRSYVEIPHPADYGERTYPIEMENRLDAIAVYANADRDDMDQNVYQLVLADRAKELRERAARPVRYAVRVKKTAEPAPAPDDDDESGEDATVSVAESSQAEHYYPCCEHCTPQCRFMGISSSGHTKPCTKPGCPSTQPASVTA
jgi:hypothetical protein